LVFNYQQKKLDFRIHTISFYARYKQLRNGYFSDSNVLVNFADVSAYRTLSLHKTEVKKLTKQNQKQKPMSMSILIMVCLMVLVVFAL